MRWSSREPTRPPPSRSTLRNRFRYARNAQIIGTLVYTELAVTWSTFQVGDYDVSGITCFGQRQPDQQPRAPAHRLVDTFRELRLLGQLRRGAPHPLRRRRLRGRREHRPCRGRSPGVDQPRPGRRQRHPAGGLVRRGGEEPAEITSITVTLTEDGHSRTVVDATPDGLVLERIQPLTLTYELVLPGGAGTVSGTCAAESVVTRIAVEPAD